MPLEEQYKNYKEMLKEKVDFQVFMEATLIYRELQEQSLTKLANSVENIEKTLAKLPCESRKSWTDSISIQQKFIWAVIVLLWAAVIELFKGNPIK